MVPPVGESLERLSWLARQHQPLLAGLPGCLNRTLYQRYLPYCHECLVFNPIDVTALHWKNQWGQEESGYCELHGTSFERLPVRVLHSSRNVQSVLRFTSKRRARDAQLRYCFGLSGVASTVHGHH